MKHSGHPGKWSWVYSNAPSPPHNYTNSTQSCVIPSCNIHKRGRHCHKAQPVVSRHTVRKLLLKLWSGVWYLKVTDEWWKSDSPQVKCLHDSSSRLCPRILKRKLVQWDKKFWKSTAAHWHFPKWRNVHLCCTPCTAWFAYVSVCPIQLQTVCIKQQWGYCKFTACVCACPHRQLSWKYYG